MSVVAFLSSRVTCSSVPTSRNTVSLSTRTTSSSKRKHLSKHPIPSSETRLDLRYLSTNASSSSFEQRNHVKHMKNKGAFRQEINHHFYALAAAGLVGLSTSCLNDNQAISNCESSNITSQHNPHSNFEVLKAFLSSHGYFYQQQSAPASTIPGRVIDVVKASVDTASEWEKKAKETVKRITNPFPQTYDVSVRALKGDRLSMEDKYCIHDEGRFAAVFDGHGGGCVSNYLSKTLYEKIKKHSKNIESEESKQSNSLSSLMIAMDKSFREVDQEVLENDDYQYQGSTAVAVWVHEDSDKGRTLLSANVGDSRAVLSHNKRAIDLTKDHKPNDAEEKSRILALGETIEWDPYCNVYRVRNLSLSRAIGDRFAKPVVSGDADIKAYPIHQCEGDDFVVLASDGLWDVMTSQECVDYINDRLNPSDEQMKNMTVLEAQQQKFTKRRNMSRFVANEALRRGSCDNVCIIIVWLNKPESAVRVP